MTRFRAFRIHNDDHGYRAGIEEMTTDALSPGEVLIKAAWSSINFKDALAGTGKGKILRQFPLNGGIDVAGHVVASGDPAFREGDVPANALTATSSLSVANPWTPCASPGRWTMSAAACSAACCP
jgi:NADPH:quinone reductase-like Zn-dependent oxidoreductase